MPSDVRFAEVKKQLERAGWTLIRISGSHHIFHKAGVVKALSIPVHRGKVKHIYVREIEKALEAQGKAQN